MHLRSETPLTNFRGVELRDFPAEIARLALIIAEFLCNVLYRGQKDALAELLPLDPGDWVVCGNALRLDWLSTCPPTGTGVKVLGDDLFATPLEQTEIDFENEGGETCVCGNPPHLGSRDQQDKQKSDLQLLFDKRGQNWKSLDFVAGWFMKAADYAIKTQSSRAASSAKSFARLNLFATCALLLVDRGSVLDRGANYRSHRATNWRRASSSAQWRDDCGGHRREFSPVSTDVGI